MYQDAAKSIAISFFDNELMMIIAVITTFTVASIDKSLNKHQKVLTYLFAILCMLYTLLAFIDFGMEMKSFETNIPLRITCCTLRHIIKPLVLVLVICSLSEKLTKSKLFYVPLVINTLLFLINLKTNICFTISDDNLYSTGLLYFVTIIIFYLYLVILAVVYQKNLYIKTVKLRITSVVIISLIAIAQIGELRAERNILGSAIMISVIFEYELLIVLKNNAQLKNKDERIKEQKNALSLSQKASLTDELTGLLNRRAYNSRIEQEAAREVVSPDFVIMMCDLNGLKTVNDKYGHSTGDELIIGAAECLKESFVEYGSIYRIGGDEFTVLLNCSEEQLNDSLKNLDSLCQNWKNPNVDELSISKGYARISESKDKNVYNLIKAADKKMYDDKQEYYKYHVKSR